MTICVSLHMKLIGEFSLQNYLQEIYFIIFAICVMNIELYHSQKINKAIDAILNNLNCASSYKISLYSRVKTNY